jgi:hypothetical protein
VVQTSTTATTNSRREKPKRVGLTWCCLVGWGVAAGVGAETDCVLFRLTVGKVVGCSETLPELLLRRSVSVPGWTLLVLLPLLIDCTLDCGLWVIVCDCESVVVESEGSAMVTIVKQTR